MNSRLETAVGFSKDNRQYREDLTFLLLRDSDLINKRILDIGSSCGGLGSYIRSLGLGCEVIDIDARSWQLPEDSTAIRGYAYHLSFGDSVFDIVISKGCIPILCAGDKLTSEIRARERTKQALEEAFRVTKPSGRIHMHWVPTIDTIRPVGLYDWEYNGQKAVAETVVNYVDSLNSKGHKAKVIKNTLVIRKS
ncbi:hypothetical protein A2799_03055 [Candidatus Roizmanbacteria bacterium RIFCSPHIGHO2_01_FULL_39_24]|uniref:Methyltransferase type 11 domain-containing protein n=1 Tax=Candidatus Roizmanbacteria bacterium RIFCSPHIGHO2_01_FULL_39_24 TaxID=1802032 RepID=A0A1F7GL20_9BACT|nr:MAG: hypothetical protein A2799_03055 [Candidatus Roizmanbacteria bacterium RIFCSPHIGHO2_01_FULL_39_24]